MSSQIGTTPATKIGQQLIGGAVVVVVLDVDVVVEVLVDSVVLVDVLVLDVVVVVVGQPVVGPQPTTFTAIGGLVAKLWSSPSSD